jgi:hypothetical protein
MLTIFITSEILKRSKIQKYHPITIQPLIHTKYDGFCIHYAQTVLKWQNYIYKYIINLSNQS